MKLLCVVPSYWPAFQFGGPIYSVHSLNKALVKKGVDVTVYTTNVGLIPSSQPLNFLPSYPTSCILNPASSSILPLWKRGIKGDLSSIQNQASSIKEASSIHADLDGVNVNYFHYTKFFEFLGDTGWQFSLPITKALKKNLKKFDIVYIISTWNFPVASASYFCREYRKPYVISPRGHLYNYVLRKKTWKKLPYYHLVLKRDLQNASAIHWTTEDEAEQCHSALGLKNKYFVIPNGIDLSEFSNLPNKPDRPTKPNEPIKPNLITQLPNYSMTQLHNIPISQLLNNLITKKVILFLGRINWIKGLDILIKAYAKLLKERDDLHLLIAGNDESGYSNRVKSWLKEFNISFTDLTDETNQTHPTNLNPVSSIKYPASSIQYQVSSIKYRNAEVTFTGMLTGTAKLEALAGSDLFVLPSYSENFGMTVVEAMACGLPVVISNKVGIYKEVERNKAGIVVDTNAESLYQGLKLLIENPDLKEEIASNGTKLVKEYYDIDKVAEKMIEIFEKILVSSPQ